MWTMLIEGQGSIQEMKPVPLGIAASVGAIAAGKPTESDSLEQKV